MHKFIQNELIMWLFGKCYYSVVNFGLTIDLRYSKNWVWVSCSISRRPPLAANATKNKMFLLLRFVLRFSFFPLCGVPFMTNNWSLSIYWLLENCSPKRHHCDGEPNEAHHLNLFEHWTWLKSELEIGDEFFVAFTLTCISVRQEVRRQTSWKKFIRAKVQN